MPPLITVAAVMTSVLRCTVGCWLVDSSGALAAVLLYSQRQVDVALGYIVEDATAARAAAAAGLHVVPWKLPPAVPYSFCPIW